MSSHAIQSSDPHALKILCAGAMSAIVGELAAAFEQTTGQGVTIEVDRSGVVRDRVRNGEAADVAITTDVAIAVLASEQRVVPETAAVIARSAIGVAIRAGAPKPDIGTVDGFKRTIAERPIDCLCGPCDRKPERQSFRQSCRPARHRRRCGLARPGDRRGPWQQRRGGLRRRRQWRGRDRHSADRRDPSGRRCRIWPARCRTSCSN